MIRVIDYPSPEVADMELPMVVSRMAVTELTLVSGGQVLEEATVQVKFGDIVTLVCSAAGGRPEVWDMAWGLTQEWWGNVTISSLQYGDNDPLCPQQNCR